ncbi:MAG: hypothetical protein BRD35_02700 [Bacteroidetes bacterium QH_7_62_13]|nr:MAG: hypothetical protein BRD35_02700 [Bacteroidetes bacterium QH_7_62_13]
MDENAETQWSTLHNGAQMGLVGGPSESEVMPLVNDRPNAEAILRPERSDRVVHGLYEIHRTGLGQSAKQLPNR